MTEQSVGEVGEAGSMKSVDLTEPLLPTDQTPKGGMSKGLKIGLGIAAGLVLLTLLGLAVWYFGFRKTDSCTNNSDCKNANTPNCVDKKCVATDYCLPICVASSDKPYCISNACVGCRSVDDCKSRTDGKTTCSSNLVCVTPSPAATDCSPICVAGSDKPYCVSKTCVGCRTVDDCKSRSDGKTICSSGQVCVAPSPAAPTATDLFIGRYQNKVVRCGGRADVPEVFVIDNGTRRWFTTGQALDRWKSTHPITGGYPDIEFLGADCDLLLTVPKGSNITS